MCPIRMKKVCACSVTYIKWIIEQLYAGLLERLQMWNAYGTVVKMPFVQILTSVPYIQQYSFDVQIFCSDESDLFMSADQTSLYLVGVWIRGRFVPWMIRAVGNEVHGRIELFDFYFVGEYVHGWIDQWAKSSMGNNVHGQRDPWVMETWAFRTMGK